jgi:predicted nucleic acid-binding protein
VADKVFLDSNVLLYLVSADIAKADAVEALLRRRPFVSVQVLNEVASVCLRKLRMAWDDIDTLMKLVRGACKVAPLTIETHDSACQLAQRYRLSFYDACIAASAHAARCRVLYTEDMHHGLAIGDGLLVQNPFE